MTIPFFEIPARHPPAARPCHRCSFELPLSFRKIPTTSQAHHLNMRCANVRHARLSLSCRIDREWAVRPSARNTGTPAPIHDSLLVRSTIRRPSRKCQHARRRKSLRLSGVDGNHEASGKRAQESQLRRSASATAQSTSRADISMCVSLMAACAAYIKL